MPTFRSSYPTYEIPTGDLWDALFDQDKRVDELRISDDKTMWIESDTGKTLAFAEIRDKAKSFGITLLKSCGLHKGDVILLSTRNSKEAGLAIFGAIYVGLVVAMVHPEIPEESLKLILEDSQGKVAVASIESAQRFETAGFSPRNIVILPNGAMTQKSHKYQYISFVENKNLPDLSPLRVKSEPEDACVILYTSATTRPLPKCVKLPHRALYCGLIQTNIVERVGHDAKTDISIAALPWSHGFGLMMMFLYPFYAGIPNVIIPWRSFDLKRFLTAIMKYRVTHIFVTPPIMDALANVPEVENFDLSTIKSAFSSGSPLSPAVIQRVKEKHGFVARQALGATETSAAVAIVSPTEYEEAIGSVGKLAANLELKLVSPTTGEELDAGSEEPGELWVRGPSIYPCAYLHNDQANQASYCGAWFRMGDMGRLTNKGYIHLFGRVADLIRFHIKNGVKILLSPEEVEAALRYHEHVKDVAVKAIKCEELGTDVPMAFVELKQGVMASIDKQQELLEFALKETGYCARYIPLRLACVQQIPRSPAGKVLRRLLP